VSVVVAAAGVVAVVVVPVAAVTAAVVTAAAAAVVAAAAAAAVTNKTHLEQSEYVKYSLPYITNSEELSTTREAKSCAATR
jgi:hypothetical protein